MTDRPDTDDPITEIRPDVYDLTLTRDPARYRAFLFDWDRPTLVDCGPAANAGTLLDRIETLDIVPERVVLTHADHDHVGGSTRSSTATTRRRGFPRSRRCRRSTLPTTATTTRRRSGRSLPSTFPGTLPTTTRWSRPTTTSS
ncbi:MBL fold metallo-hydrolase [Halomicroarcula sp. GCM10025709]|uniref:MBL fold metallo-hydrolase n=1 Tax=Halomicroarcula sp. GCM10025709 TaxID=3252669 RepID=UPI0036221F9D